MLFFTKLLYDLVTTGYARKRRWGWGEGTSEHSTEQDGFLMWIDSLFSDGLLSKVNKKK